MARLRQGQYTMFLRDMGLEPYIAKWWARIAYTPSHPLHSSGDACITVEDIRRIHAEHFDQERQAP